MKLDLFMVACDRDIKLLRHFFLSYELFFKSTGKIHLCIWRKDQELLDQIDIPVNLIIHYKDNISDLVEDDFRNQMYLKLIADRYVDSEWFWAVDADYLITSPLKAEDFFSEGKPHWFYRPWLPLPERAWRAGSELFLCQEIEYLFMDEPQYILNKSILKAFQKSIDVKKILSLVPCPSEFISYAAYAHLHHYSEYSWKDVSADNAASISFRINQRPPSYSVLHPDTSLKDAVDAKYVVFWSHWDLADEKMRQFLSEAQLAAFGNVKKTSSFDPLRLRVTAESFREHGPLAWDGCYADGWVKKNSAFFVETLAPAVMQIELEALTGMSEPLPKITVNVDGVEEALSLTGGRNTVPVTLSADHTSQIAIRFDHGTSEFEGGGRMLYARVLDFKLQTLDEMIKVRND